jgi:dethiobiotin synthetase
MNNNKPAFFVTGTDTDCGKTYVCAALIRHLQQGYKRVAGLKPIASGFELVDGRLQNSDVEALNLASNVALAPEHINRYSYRPAIAPHIAARQVGDTICTELIEFDVAIAIELVDALVVEGVGGWLVPLSECGSLSIEVLAQRLKLPVILVVGMKLGCLSHALLTARAIVQSGVPFAGWVANHIDPAFDFLSDNIATLESQMPVPKLFELPYLENSDKHAEVDACSDHWLALIN